MVVVISCFFSFLVIIYNDDWVIDRLYDEGVWLITVRTI